MTLTSERKKEIWKHYDTWMQAYLNADVETYDSYFHDDYHFIGSTDNEEFLNRKDTTEFFKVTGDQFAGLMDLRNESKTLEQFNKLIFITHFCDVWFLNEDQWSYYGRFRLSSVMKQTDSDWRFIYQHFSMPDSKSDEGQTIGFENVKTENIELKEAIKRRTQELELKNRELEIESALSCIRAQATAMKKSSDLLDIVVTMRNEFIKLGHEAHYFWHMMWLPYTYEKAMTSGDGTRIGFVMTLPRHIHGNIPLLAKWEKSKKSTVVYTMDVDAAIDYVDKMVNLGDFQNIDPQAPSHDDIRHIGGLTFVMARTSHGEIGFSLPGVVKNPPKKDLEILVQFAGAFDLAHRRFLDLQKAEKQAREVEIELALEKVRSRTMAMQKSEELSEASFLLDSQVRELGMNTWGCAFNIYGKEESTEWFGNEKGELNTYKVPRIGVFKDYYDKGHQGETLLIREFSGDECIEHYEFMSTLPGIGDVLKQLKKTNNGFPTYQIDHVVYFKYGYLLFITREPVPESHEVFKRFASVFEQTYTRFLDLQKAEQQAREAQIEAALEKVRSRSLAVHKSDEFNEVVSIVFEKLKELQIPATAVGIGIKIEGSKDLNSYVCGENEAGLVITNYRLPYFNNKISKDLCTAIENELSFYVGRYTKKVKNAFYKHVLEHTNEFKDLPDDILKMIFESSSYTISMVASKHVVFNINDFEGKALTKYEVDILKRFSKVFNQAYIRFLDLQKAEAQAREAQIEASLERVRAHSMAMHSSDELKDVIRLIFNQMRQININAEHAGIVVDYEPKKDWHFWVAETQDIPAKITIPYNDLIWDRQFTEAKQTEKQLFTTLLNFKEKNAFYKKLLPHIEGLTREMRDHYFERDGLAISTAIQKDVALYIENFSGTPYTEEENATLIRFAKVFQQTYTRFLDLQKAEAQARESEIQLAMERVRASTMAMHHSEELSTVLSTLFEQFDILGINPSHAVLTLINKEKNTLTFRTTGKNGYQVYAEQEVDLNLVDNWIDTTEKWKKSNPNTVNVNEYPPEILPEVWDTYNDVLSAMPKKARPALKDFPKGLFITEGYCLFGYIGFAHSRKPTEEEKDIVRRLASEFGTLYQRFLDLQKTEAQAKEAKIEAALERIRSRSLAMHNSSELSAVVDTLLQEFTNLEITLTFCIINLVNEEDKSNTVWAANPETGKDPESYYMKFEDYPFHHAMWDAWKTQKKRFVYTISGKEKQVYDNYLFSDTEFKRFPKHVQEANKALERYVAGFTFSKYSGLQAVSQNDISEEDLTILERFGKVFEQAYTRFLDLQKAETQAKEAQIEAALERVRSRSMAMHQSEEIAEVATVLFQQLKSLGGELWASGFGFCEVDSELDDFWFVTESDVSPNVKIPNTTDPAHKQMYEGWKNKQDFFSMAMEGKELEEHYKYMLTVPDIQPVFQNIINQGIDFPIWQKWHAAYYKYGYLLVITTEEYEEEAVFKRFAKVFEQAYTRFLDLKKAEAQAREAQIEAALEKVRSRTMAMQKGEELKEVVVLLYKELIALGVTNFVTCGYVEINENTGKQSTWVTHPGGDSLGLFYLPLKGDAIFDERYNAWKNQQIIFHQTVAGKQRKEHLDYAITTFNSKEAEEMVLSQFPDPTVFYCFNFSHGYLHIVAGSQLKEDEEALLARFTKVFEQTYARFLDLQRAEFQAREAQINLAVERVRAKALAMHKSEEIMEVVAKLKDEVMSLEIPGVVAASIFLKVDNDTIRMWDLSSLERSDQGYLAITDITFKLKKKDPHLYIKRVWENPKDYFIDMQNSKDLNRIIEFMYENNQLEVAKEVEDYVRSTNLNQLYHAAKCLNNGKLCIDLLEAPPEEMQTILNKMGAAFDLAYKRFEDIKRAEAQAREAQIETALEKVRSRTMAMQKSEELPLAANNLFLQVQELGIPAWSAGYCIWQDDKHNASCNMSSEGEIQKGFILPSIGEGYDFYTPQENGEHFHVKELGGEGLVKHYEFMMTLPNVGDILNELIEAGLELPKFQIFHICYFKHGYVMFITYEEVPEAHDIFKRFGQVFEQTYTRFLDLERAEAQTREAQIEMALEKVRSRTMAMQKSEELRDAAQVLFNEVQNLGIPSWSCGYNILSNDKKSAECWMSSEGQLQKPFTLTFEKEASFIEMYDFFKNKDTFLIQELDGNAIKEHYDYMMNLPDLAHIVEDLNNAGIDLPTYQINHLCKFSKGYLLFITYEKVPDAHEIFRRFTAVFEQTYTRFLDLKDAEARARESKIQAALERVRSQSMGMQSTKDFGEVTTEMFNQLRGFGEDLFATGIVFCDKHEGHVEQWHSIPGGGMLSPMIVPVDLDYIHQYRYDQWKAGNELFSIEIPSDFIEQHFEDIFKLPSAQITLKDLESRNAPMPAAPPWEIDYGASFNKGYILISSLKPLENTDILPRFAHVFEQAYTRFLDLKKAEAQTRESQIEAALEKVRSRSLSMQNPDELEDVVTLIAEKLKELDVILDLGGVVICTYFKNSKDVMHWIATSDSESSGKFLLPYFDHVILNESWASKNNGDQWFSKAFTLEEKNTFFQYAFKHSDYKHFPDEAKKDILKRKHHTLSFAWSKHSALLIPSYSGLTPTENDKNILIRFAKVFEQAYIRFTDLQEKELQAKALFEEKQRLEETLSDLQTTQKQLVQSEKMASLGELTAGIAHEIQNPLNFVNNFSEVSKELLEEMQEEIENGDFEEVKAIMVDVIQNLDKINHHGKRADGIVKGMLQHSRASGDKKEPTDINALADEYLRLAYHGLRAKDKSFNAELVTDFDDSIESVMAVPQDVGRVILNLLTNAFYVVNEKKKMAIENYKPTVSISTEKKKDTIEIKVTDNGNGMPESVKEKIFQPFFTTKPTGQGTGLGLSLSYDIITKGHGGNLKVETKENVGTTFIIQLPEI